MTKKQLIKKIRQKTKKMWKTIMKADKEIYDTFQKLEHSTGVIIEIMSEAAYRLDNQYTERVLEAEDLSYNANRLADLFDDGGPSTW